MNRWTRSSALAAAVLALSAPVSGGPLETEAADARVEVLRGTQPSPSFASFPDVVVLRGARVGGAVPPPEPPAPAAPAAPTPPPATTVQVFVAPAATLDPVPIWWPVASPRGRHGRRHGEHRHAVPGFWPAPHPEPRAR